VAIKVIDMHGNERDWAWVQATYGNVGISPIQGEGYRVVQLTEIEGWMGFTCTVLSEAGGPVVGQRVAYMWPAPPTDEVIEITNGSGTAEHQAGPGEGYFLPGPGPISWEVRGVASERISGLGWLGNTNHRHLQVIFRLSDDGEEPPPPPDGGGVAEAILAVAAELKRVANALWEISKK
jgi:hypothetical protein